MPSNEMSRSDGNALFYPPFLNCKRKAASSKAIKGHLVKQIVEKRSKFLLKANLRLFAQPTVSQVKASESHSYEGYNLMKFLPKGLWP